MMNRIVQFLCLSRRAVWLGIAVCVCTNGVTAQTVNPDPASKDPFYNGSQRNADFWVRDDARVLPTPQTRRMTDAAIHQDYMAYEAQQARINATQGNPYATAKAQCWLDVSFQEYTRNDRSSFVEEAFLQSKKITDALRAGGTDQPWMTLPLINKATDKPAPIAQLWKRMMALTLEQRQCKPAQSACAEVELIHAGNEWNQGGAAHAKPYLALADRYLSQAEQSNCAPVVIASKVEPPPVAIITAPPPVVAPVVVVAPPVIVKPVIPSLAQRVHFAYDEAYIGPATVKVLDAIAQTLKAHPGIKLQAIGHTDLRANDQYNSQLSMRRVSNVQQYLQAAGLMPGQVQLGLASGGAGAAGRQSPSVLGSTEKAYQMNRRVEFSLATGSSPAELVPQFDDLQPCGTPEQYWCDSPKHPLRSKAPESVQKQVQKEKAAIDALLRRMQTQR
jgi:OmpA-OmpF porin, OOP family